jgi:hypothetical protein
MSRIRLVWRYARIDARTHPSTLFVFGDNMARKGLGGQAREMRGEPNAVGIPTKWLPSLAAGAYFSDEDLERVKPSLDEAFDKLEAHLAAGGDVVWPDDGIGTGLAELPSRAPAIHAYIASREKRLFAMAK